VFNLSETEVHDVMVPRIDILGVDFDDPWSEVLDRVRSSGHARLPVYRETLDEIVGILYAKDLLPAVIEDEPPQEGWHKLIRPALFIPPTKPVDDQLREFRASGTHIAIVVDEYGGTAGLVTIEDVLEELVGEIQDEYDEELPLFEKEDGTKWWVSARLSLDELSEMIGHDFHREGVNTVGGLIYDLLGRVPRSGEELVIDNFRVVVERVVKRRIQRVYFEGHDPTDSEEDQAHAEREA
jgi:putative hemolysin